MSGRGVSGVIRSYVGWGLAALASATAIGLGLRTWNDDEVEHESRHVQVEAAARVVSDDVAEINDDLDQIRDEMSEMNETLIRMEQILATRLAIARISTFFYPASQEETDDEDDLDDAPAARVQ